MTQKQVERQSLIVSTIGNFIIGLAGLIIYIVTDLNALLLDGVFSLIAFISTLAAVFISINSHRKTATFPNGMYFLEPLYGILKSIATLMLLIITLLETSAAAYAYFSQGKGSLIETNLVLPYTITMVILCFSLGFYNRQKNHQINNLSTIIAAESKGNFIDGLISAGVGISILLLKIIPIESSLGFLHYTADFFITLILVIFSYKEPLAVLTDSFKEFTQSPTRNKQIVTLIHDIFQTHFNKHYHDLDIFIYKQGTHISIRVHILDPTDLDLISHSVNLKPFLLEDLRDSFEFVTVEFAF
ncbi:cation transporter [Streptococcus thoraltensis]|uniref:cation transporter n=1 Tax=Streptococcus thoraltensis TaxID=55085 RepID=UPI000362420B|nr:cation transporter [Streptococcus thoraltensis]MDY4761144.1 cation transporter [Streptococcus thoraltensis]